MNGALSGLKVLDFSTLLPGPFATMMLADMGAEVVHVESPSRVDLVRMMPPYANGQATAHSYLNRNKQSIALDLKDQSCIELIKSKINDYDIVVEQFRPEVMKRLGLDYEILSQINPRLIYCSITGYGQTGSYRHRAGHDINYLAISGIAGQSGRKVSGPPPLGVQVADVAGGSLHAVIAILAAVFERGRSGLGQYIDISMTDCAVSLNSLAGAAQLAADHPVQAESEVLNGASFYDYYRCADGRYVSIGGLEPKFIQGLAQLLDLPIIAEKALSPNLEHQQQVKATIQEKIATQPLIFWQELFATHDLCVEPVLMLGEALDSALADERDWTVNVPLNTDHADQQSQRQLANPIKFSRSSMRYDFVGQALGAGKW
ncbi:Crotonobetainyl-CoA:carnitine CoA-transferase CaiB [Acinetobacter marinus]|uniref:Crotonobetainyl-CoA:carnitine CoA-transferase CaiB n=1 Tax=Acinetobacter marinus TaxID=281375 RepID=A0A1G6KY08_9GAMM|nr:CaiB/BaiF CoA-transferase family protein [Acinetobacter marinus]SDC35708.1 Crotonobetainyl-CoA:carnitine CoA-transferase CaiB [Acinetobacter marinus]